MPVHFFHLPTPKPCSYHGSQPPPANRQFSPPASTAVPPAHCMNTTTHPKTRLRMFLLHQHTAKPQSGTSQRSPPPQPTLALAGTTRTATSPRIACSPHLQQHSGTHCKRSIHLCRGARCHMQLVLGTLVWTGGYHQSSPLRYVSSMQDLYRNFHGCKTGVMVI